MHSGTHLAKIKRLERLRDEFIRICDDSKSMAEASRRLGISFTTFRRYAVYYGCYKTNQPGTGLKRNVKSKIKTEDILSGMHPQYSTSRLHGRLVSEGILEEKCNRCGINEWHGQRLSLHLHHKDGIDTNNHLDNLEILCPNCHSITDTYCSGNRSKLRERMLEYEDKSNASIPQLVEGTELGSVSLEFESL